MKLIYAFLIPCVAILYSQKSKPGTINQQCTKSWVPNLCFYDSLLETGSAVQYSWNSKNRHDIKK